MTPDEYRDRWGPPKDYPMVARRYAEQRSKLAKQIGLRTRRSEPPAAPAPASKVSRSWKPAAAKAATP